MEAEDWQGRQHRQRITHFLRPPRQCRLARADVQMRVDGETIELSTDKPAFYLTVESPERPLLLSDNSITLLPGERITMRVLRGGPVSASELSCRHLRQTYR